jgi:multicomponent Na+:H+ antiporter subunit A
MLAALLAVVLLPILGAVATGGLGRRPVLAAAVAAIALGGSALAAAVLVPGALSEPMALTVPWAAPLGPDLSLRADALGLVLALLVGVVGVGVVVYAASYLHGDPNLPRLLPTLLVFASAMQLLALADDVWLVFVAWELTSVCSYLLVQHTRTPEALRAATTALLVTGLGGLALLGGVLLVQEAAGTARLSELAAARDTVLASPLATPALLLVILGCATKSALFPFYFWLPGAMAAPTPISTYLHAATMVKAGIFLLARMHPTFGGTALWEGVLGVLGAATVGAATLRLAGSDDLKQLLAWSTVLALGTLATLLALDGAAAALAVVVLLIAHAGYKGTLFLVVGSLDHGAGTRSQARLGGLARAMPWTALAGLLGAASMMGLPPFAGFVAKEQIKLAGAGWLGSATLAVSAVALVAVAWWVGVRPFWGRRPAGAPDPAEVHESSPAMLVPALVLAAAGLALGVGATWLLAPLVSQAAADIAGQAVDAGLATLPGEGAKILAALAILALGAGVAWAQAPLARLAARLPADLCARGWDAAVHGLIAAGRACVHVTQHGDLRSYLATILLVACAMAAPGLVDARLLQAVDPVPLWALPVVALLAVGAVVAAGARERLGVVAGLGAVGYGMAMLFVGLGAPDLALTQVLVETLTVVLLVLAFRHLPDLAPRENGRRLADLAVAGVVGLVTAGLVLAAQAVEAPGLGPQLIAGAWERGQGANAVNVILVDIRALDTLGEITVLLLAVVGVVALIQPATTPRPLLPRSPILAAASLVILLLAVLLAIYFWWRGHHQPGGGFAAGLALGAGLILMAAARGGAAVRRILPVTPLAMAAIGLALALASALVGVVAGGGLLAPHWVGPLGTPLLFDLGVALLSAGIGVQAVESLLEAEEGGA